MSRFVAIAFYTPGPYAAEAARLSASAERVGVECLVDQVPDLGSWQANVNHKARFILRMLDDPRVAGRAVVYVDADAEFKRYPALFDELPGMGADLAVAYLDQAKYYRRPAGCLELVASTIWVANNDGAWKAVAAWAHENDLHPLVWDQKNLQAVLERMRGLVRVRALPDEYFKIFDTMAGVKDPVIEQYQKSRVYRRRRGSGPVLTVSHLRDARILNANDRS